jgi:hypothetical protein
MDLTSCRVGKYVIFWFAKKINGKKDDWPKKKIKIDCASAISSQRICVKKKIM